MTNFVRNFVRDEAGAAAAEYALILAIVGAGIAAAAFLLGGNVSKAMTKSAETVCTQQTSGAAVC
ncbi:Flp family type IVb pilin [Novosphingobium sp.]|uniref:Flp family type IVb pilin n=1 Tax=Novosphingobium sp. TaxID=1874826 RepID=UPI0025F7E409|nr:Flp family type IVb pilin [Novosphingobium sp.]